MNHMLPASEFDMASQHTFLIRVKGNVSALWLDYFDDITIIVSAEGDEAPISTVCARHADQAGLMGILNNLYNFGYPILYVIRLTT